MCNSLCFTTDQVEYFRFRCILFSATQDTQFRPKSVVPLLPTICSLCSSSSSSSSANTSIEVEVDETVAVNAFEKGEALEPTSGSTFTETSVVEAAMRIQRAVRGWLKARQRCRQKLCFVVEVQSHARAFLARQRVLARQRQLLDIRVNAAVIIQSAWRAYAARRRLVLICSASIQSQTPSILLNSNRCRQFGENFYPLLQTKSFVIPLHSRPRHSKRGNSSKTAVRAFS